VKRELERIEIPGEHDARVRAWEVVSAAYAERDPAPRRTPFLRPLLATALVAVVVAAAVTPPGRAVVASVRRAVGVEAADEALFRLPGGGRLLVASSSGAWVVGADGSQRRLGDYSDAAWSPFGRYVAATREHELVALEPDGDVRWKLARPDVAAPSWGGTRLDTRVAYVSGGELHVVTGDGRTDVILGAAAPVRPAWRPGSGFVLAYADARGRVVVYDVRARRVLARRRASPRRIAWSGERLLLDAAVSGQGSVATIRRVGSRSELRVDGGLRFSGTGTFTSATWSPDARWILVSWSEPDQWLFVSASGRRRVRAAAGIARQFDSTTPPRVVGWCCGPPAASRP